MKPDRLTLLLVALTLAPPAPLLAQEAVSSAGHSRTRALAALGKLPSPADVIVEDIINYHRHRLPAPRAGEAVAVDVRWGWDRGGRAGEAVLQVGLATAEFRDQRDLPPLNLCLVIDCSGSMADEDKLIRVKEALRRFVGGLRPSDRLALVAFSDAARVVRKSACVEDGRGVREGIEELTAHGATNLHAGLMAGYAEVNANAGATTANRVILLTDGLANRGVTDPELIGRDSRAQNREGSDLSTIGLGRSIQWDLLQELSRAGRGTFHFVGDAQDIEKIFVKEFQGLVAPAARGLSVRVEFPRGMELTHLYGYKPKKTDGGFEIDLADMGLGATQVILAKVSTRASVTTSEDLSVRVEVRVQDSVSGGVRRLEQRTLFPSERERGSTDDHVVRKNFTIAQMARALHEMAELAERRRFGEADRLLQQALALARERYPSGTEKDVARVVNMVKEFRRVLGGHVESVRDL